MKETIQEIFKHLIPITLPQNVNEGRYDLVSEDKTIILPSMWDSAIKPGSKVSMHMWPLPPQMQARPPSHRPGMPGWQAGAPPPPRLPPLQPGVKARVDGAPRFSAGASARSTLSVSIPKPKPSQKKSKLCADDISSTTSSGSSTKKPRRRRMRTVRRQIIDDTTSCDSDSDSDNEENRLAPEEEEELRAVDFAEVVKEAEEGKDAVAEMLRRFTNITDVESGLGDIHGAGIWSSSSEGSGGSSDSD